MKAQLSVLIRISIRVNFNKTLLTATTTFPIPSNPFSLLILQLLSRPSSQQLQQQRRQQQWARVHSLLEIIQLIRLTLTLQLEAEVKVDQSLPIIMKMKDFLNLLNLELEKNQILNQPIRPLMVSSIWCSRTWLGWDSNTRLMIRFVGFYIFFYHYSGTTCHLTLCHWPYRLLTRLLSSLLSSLI